MHTHAINAEVSIEVLTRLLASIASTESVTTLAPSITKSCGNPNVTFDVANRHSSTK